MNNYRIFDIVKEMGGKSMNLVSVTKKKITNDVHEKNSVYFKILREVNSKKKTHEKLNAKNFKDKYENEVKL